MDYYDFHARNYDAQLGRWNSPDILMEMYSSESPYSFTLNNPVNLTDPTGMYVQNDGCSGRRGEWKRGEYIACGGGGKTAGQKIAEQRDNFNAWVDANVAEVNKRRDLLNLYDGDIVTDLTAFGRTWNPFQSLRYTFKDGTVLFVDLGKESILSVSQLGYFGDKADVNNSFFSDGVWTVGFTGTASASFIGGSFELGITLDFRSGFQIGGYATLEHAVIADLSLGVVTNYHKPINYENNFSISNLSGWGESFNGGIWYLDGTYGGNSLNSGLSPYNYSDNHSIYSTYGLGVSIGLPIGFTKNKGYTWTTPTIGW